MPPRQSIYRPPTIYRRGLTQTQYQEQLNQQDMFPLLSFRELSVHLQNCNFIANEELLTKPTSTYIRSLFEQVLDSFMGVNNDTINKMIAQAQKGAVDSSRVDQASSQQPPDPNGAADGAAEDDISSALHLVMFYRVACQFLIDCGIYDFSVMDMMRPEPFRMKRILSAIINYAKFRSDLSVEPERLLAVCENHFDTLRKAEHENIQLTNKITLFKRKLEQQQQQQQYEPQDDDGDDTNTKKASLKQIMAYNKKLTLELEKLQKYSNQLNLELTKYKNEKKRVAEKMEDNEYLTNELEKEIELLKLYMQTDVPTIKRIIGDLKADLERHHETTTSLTSSNRNLAITIESFKEVESELKQLFKNLEDIMQDLAKEEKTIDKLRSYQDLVSQLEIESLDLRSQIGLVEKQLETQQAKIERLERQLQERIELSKQKLDELNQEYSELLNEKQKFEDKLNEKNSAIDEFKAKIKTKTKEYEDEFKEAELSLEKLNLHVRFYITEMTKQMEATLGR